MKTRTPPHSIEAEQALIGGLLIRNASWAQVEGIVTPDDFYLRGHQLIFETIAEMLANNEPADVITVTEKLKDKGLVAQTGGFEALATMAAETPSGRNLGRHAKIIRELSDRRRMAEVGAQIMESALDPRAGAPVSQILDEAQALLMAGTATPGKKYDDVMDEVLDRIQRRSRGELRGVSTGLGALDRITTGMHAGELWIVAARPGMGKTALGLGIAEHVARDGRVMLYELEMPTEQVAHRSLARASGVDIRRLRTGDLDDRGWDALVRASETVRQYGLIVDDTSGLHIDQIRYRSRKAHRRGRLSLIVVDYLQLVDGSGPTRQNRTQEVGHISRALKGLAKELDVPIVALAQLSRRGEERASRRPQMADVRDSGEVEQDADVIIGLYRDEVYQPQSPYVGVAELILLKQRNGPIGRVYVSWDGPTARFGDMPEDWTPPREEPAQRGFDGRPIAV